jgi:RimJ/RimL family protein N-acetyltransferase
VLRGDAIVLEPLAEAHREPLRAAAADERIWTWMNRLVTSEEGGFDALFDERLAAREGGADWPWAILAAPSGEALGSSSYLNARPEHDGVEIGWTWLNPSAWRTGANREAKLLLLGFAFDELGCIRVEFKTDARNERSRAALEALPATFEGVFRDHMLMPGIGRRDSAYYSIVDSEWPAVRAGLQAGKREASHA